MATAHPLLAGAFLSLLVALAAVALEPLLGRVLQPVTGLAKTLPAMVIALLIGMALAPLAAHARFQPGITFCVKKLLRVAIALLGVRIAFSDIIALGAGTALLVVLSMALTLLSGLWLARRLGLSDGYGMLAGAATAVCGASATLATSTVVPDYKGKERDTAFTVIAANAVSTLVMVAYPPLALWLGLSAQETGILLGATIHDMAQVVGAGYAVSEPVGNTAVVVKLFRVLLLLPVVLIIGWWFVRASRASGDGPAAKVPVPVFALVFLALVAVNSLAPAVPALAPLYAAIKPWLSFASTWGLLVAIAALGLGTSILALLAVGWRAIAAFFGTTTVILVVVAAGLFMLR
jgi:uncharacterized integral membrane protein (TIGR00698 family)